MLRRREILHSLIDNYHDDPFSNTISTFDLHMNLWTPTVTMNTCVAPTAYHSLALIQHNPYLFKHNTYSSKHNGLMKTKRIKHVNKRQCFQYIRFPISDGSKRRRSCFVSRNRRHPDTRHVLLRFYVFKPSQIHESGIILTGIERGRWWC